MEEIQGYFFDLLLYTNTHYYFYWDIMGSLVIEEYLSCNVYQGFNLCVRRMNLMLCAQNLLYGMHA